jgi:SAM-dependent methyltransferase
MTTEFASMGLNVKAKLDSAVNPDLKKKVAAWWQGVDVDDLEGWDNKSDLENSDEAEPDQEAAPVAGPDPFSTRYDISHLIVVSQKLWGAGFTSPGGNNFIEEWGQQLSLNKEKSTAFLGCGLGGQAREISKSTGSWVTGYDRHPEFVEEGADQANMAGMTKNATSAIYNPENPELPEKKYNAVISKEEFCFVDNKSGLLDSIKSSLKSGGLLLFTDYLAKGSDVTEDQLLGWFGDLQGKASLWTEVDYVSKLEACGLDIHVNEDFSDRYVEFIGSGWSGYREIVQDIKGGEDSDQEKACLLHCVADAAERWTRIAEALGSGQLEIRRFLARKS